ncbi:hypothetical protein Fmac_023823 [Flemingia macrophylla]|uniref:Uncharacterized protein n=1 Tax=Flemingia macrophylla TaxID=520843 RepID=A0ABD1LML0_9FABA
MEGPSREIILSEHCGKSLHLCQTRHESIYLLDYVCYLPPDNLRVPYSHMVEHFELCNFD